jgi:AcrR family transcriptional regulator
MMAKVTQAHVDARRADILNAASELFSSKGWQDTSMQEVAAAAGLSTGAIYRYYPSKDDLLRAIFEDATGTMRQTFAEEGARATSPLDAILRVGKRILSSEECHDPSMFLESALAMKVDPEEWAPRRRAFALDTLIQIEELVAQGQAAGQINPGLDPKTTSQILYALVPGLAALWMEQGDQPDIDAVMDTVGAMLSAGREGGVP